MRSFRKYTYNWSQLDYLFGRLESLIEIFKQEDVYLDHKVLMYKDKAILLVECK